jgi:acyl transferase domain-containing protein
MLKQHNFHTVTHGHANRDIAIVGMACLFPRAPDVQTYWENIVSGVDAIADAPEDWEGLQYYDPEARANDRIYCKRGGFLTDLRFHPSDYGVMPLAVDGADPDHFIGLMVAAQALADASCDNDEAVLRRTQVIVGRGTYINRAYTNQLQHCLIIDQTLQLLKELHPEHGDAELKQIKDHLKASLAPFNCEVAPGLVPNVMTGRIANRLDLMGANYTVDAACASSLVSTDLAVEALLNGKCDLALAGGANVATAAPTFMLFCQLDALSRTGEIRPFDRDADGTLLGEGFGMLVLKRLADAERDEDRIYALIKGIGVASDGRARALLAPRVEGEELAIRRAYEASGVSPDTVGLVEAHGTATPVGDLAEVEALRRVFGERKGPRARCALGTVKSMIGHLIPAAGMAGLIKTALALHHKVLPPTLHCENPNPKLGLEQSPFYINKETRPWIHGALTPRRAGVNAFGFGGINAHAVLEEYDPHAI